MPVLYDSALIRGGEVSAVGTYSSAGGVLTYYGPITADGYSFTSTRSDSPTNDFVSWDQTWATQWGDFYDGPSTLAFGSGFVSTLARSDGASFSLVSMEVDSQNATPVTETFVGTRADGSQTTFTFTTDTAQGFQTIDFGAALTNVVSVTMSQSSGANVQFDAVNVMQNSTWTAGVSGTWTTAWDWSAGVPGSGMSATIAGGASQSFDVSIASSTLVGSLALDAPAAALDVSSTLTVNNELEVQAGKLHLAQGATLNASGGLLIDSGGELYADGAGVKTVNGSIVDDSDIYAEGVLGGALVINGAVSGTGFIVADYNNVELKASSASTIKIDLDNQLTLKLDQAAQVASQIYFNSSANLDLSGATSFGGVLHLSGTSTVDLLNVVAQSYSYTGGVLTLTEAGGRTLSLNVVSADSASGYSVYATSDGSGGTTIALDEATAAAPLSVVTPAATPAAVYLYQLTNGATDSEGNGLSVVAASLDPSDAADGTLVLDTTHNQLVFTPAAGFSGPVTATYTLSDGAGATATGVVDFTVEAPQQANWTGGGGDWGVSTHWSTGSAPGPGDHATIAGASGFNVYVDNSASVGTLTVDGLGVKTLVSLGTLTVNGQAEVAEGDIELSQGGTLDASGGLLIDATPGVGFGAELYSQAGGGVVNANVVNNNIIETSGAGTLLINGNITGSGLIAVDENGDANNELEINGAVAQEIDVYSTATLKLGQAAKVTSDIYAEGQVKLDLAGASSFGGVLHIDARASDSVDLVGVALQSYSYTGGVLTIEEAGGGSLSLSVEAYTGSATPPAGYGVVARSDGAGGVLLSLDKATAEAPLSVVTPASTPVDVAFSQLLAGASDSAGLPLTVASAVLDPSDAADGTLVFDAAHNQLVFTPAAGFSGPVTATYTLTDSAGATTTGAVDFTVKAPQQVNWTGGSGAWSDTTRWSTGSPPGAADSASFNTTGIVSVDSPAAVGSLSFNSTASILYLEVSSSLTVNGAANFGADTHLELRPGATFTALGGLSIAYASVLLHDGVVDADIANAGLISSSGLVIHGDVTGSGHILDWGDFELDGATAQQIELQRNATLKLDKAGSVTSQIVADDQDKLDLSGASSFGGVLELSGSASSLDLVGVALQSWSYDAGTGKLTISEAGGGSLSLTVHGQSLPSGAVLYVRTDGAGGALVSFDGIGSAPLSVVTPASTPVDVAFSQLLAGASDSASLPLTVASAVLDPSDAADGTLVFDAAHNQLVFTPAAGFSGPVTATYTLTDSAGATTTGAIDFTVKAPQQVNWTLGSGAWSDTTRWSTGSPPGAADSASFNTTGIVSVDSPAAVGSLSFNSTASILYLEVSSSLTVNGAANFGADTHLELRSGATFTALGGLSIAYASVLLHDGVVDADIANAGLISSSGLVIHGDVTGSGHILDWGDFELDGATAQQIELQSNATLKLDKAASVTSQIVADDQDKLDLSGASSFGGVLELSGSASSLDLVGVALQSWSYDAGTGALTIDEAGGGALSLTVRGQSLPSGYGLAVRSDGSGGTLISFESTPVLQADFTRPTYSHAGAPVLVRPDLTITDAEAGQILSATVTIDYNFLAGDQLNFTDQNGITGAYDASTGVLTLTGAASVAAYQAALQSVTYSSSAADPTNGGTDLARAVHISIYDGLQTVGIDRSVGVASPIFLAFNASTGGPTQFSYDGTQAQVLSSLSISDGESTTLGSATVSVTGGAGGRLNFTAQNGISGAYDAATGVLTLSGTASVAAYQAALQSVTYAPATPGEAAPLSVSVSVGDGASSNSVSESLVLTPPDQSFTLTRGGDTIKGFGGSNTLHAAGSTLGAGDRIDAGPGGSNVLQLDGGGSFDLRAPATLTGVATIEAQDGQWAQTGSQQQVLWLRDGMHAVVDVGSATTSIPGDPYAPSITIHGADDSDVINLGGGQDTVVLGGGSETVNGGSGHDIYYVTAATEGATITGGSGENDLHFTGGGTVVMGSQITGINYVILDNPAAGATQPDYVFTANATQNLRIFGSNGDDTITVGDASQFVQTGAGSSRVVMTAATAGAGVRGVSGGSTTLDLQGGGTFDLNPLTWNVTAQLDQAGSTLVLSKSRGVNVTSLAGGNTVVAYASSLGAGVSITLAGSNTLQISGGGAFDLSQLAGLSGIATIDAQDGQWAASGSQLQKLYMRDGLNVTVDVASDTALIPGNPYTPGFGVVGANDSDVFNLGDGLDTVWLGSAAETVNGGAGQDLVWATAATVGALVHGGSGTMTINVTGGGAVAMNANDARVQLVHLEAAAAGYSFTADSETGLLIQDLSTGADSITAGGKQQTITGGGAGQLTMTASAAGRDYFKDASALFDGDTITNFGASAGNVIDVTDMNSQGLVATFKENASGTGGVLTLNDGTHAAAITLLGQFAAAGFSGSAASAGFTTSFDGRSGTDVTWAITAPHH